MKYLLLSISCLMVPLCSFSQLSTFSFGVKAGVDVPMFTGKPANQQSIQGFSGGIQGEQRFSEFNLLAAELMFSYVGFSNVLNPTSENPQEVKAHLSMLDLPLFYKRKFMQNSFILMGVQPGYFIDNAVNGAEQIKGAEGGRNDFQFALMAGLGYKMDVGFTCDARFNFGLTDLYKESNMKLNMFHVSAGWMF